MAIITLTEYKQLMGEVDVDTTRDARISALIPQIEADIVAHCNNDFTNPDIAFTGDFVPTVSSGSIYTLVCSDGGISDISFANGDQFVLSGTIRNDGRLTSTTFADTVITVSDVLVAEAEVSASITLIQYPAGLQIYAARMIAYQLSHMSDAGITSESIGKYSYSRASGGSSDAGYPNEILRGIDRWKNIKVGRGRRVEHYTDKRGTFIPVEIKVTNVAR
jgi:hypothetical protein